MKRITVALLLVITFGAGLTGQAPVPTVSELDSAKIDRATAQLENYALKIQILQAEQAALRASTQAFVDSLKKPGFTLTRTEKGWVYVVEKK
jgi:hypothetical protein